MNLITNYKFNFCLIYSRFKMNMLRIIINYCVQLGFENKSVSKISTLF